MAVDYGPTTDRRQLVRFAARGNHSRRREARTTRTAPRESFGHPYGSHLGFVRPY
jgi:hypothetical protein